MALQRFSVCMRQSLRRIVRGLGLLSSNLFERAAA